MADSTVPNLATASALTGSELFYAVQSGGDVKVLGTQIMTMVGGFPALFIAQVNKGTVGTGTVTFDVSASSKQKLTVSGALAIAFTGWPASGTYAEVEIELINGSTNVTWPTVNWLVGDGTTSTTFSAMGVTLSASGANHVIVWSADGGTTLYGKAG